MIDVNGIFQQRISDIQSRLPVKLRFTSRVSPLSSHNAAEFQPILTQKVNSADLSGLSSERKAVVGAAVSLVGKVDYFWGGKSDSIGWDERWGVPRRVTAEGSRTTDTIRPFGLDCSGFVAWAFANAGKDVSSLGYGTIEQNAKSARVAWGDARVGDLAFYSDLSHVGIVAGYDEGGNMLVVHCSGGSNNVVLERAEAAGFDFISRPNVYNS